jgi:hypothetical protein
VVKKYLPVTIVLGIIILAGRLAFSVLFYEERLMIDGSYMVFEMCNKSWFPDAQNRYIIWLLDLLPVTAINLQLPLKAIILLWYVNYFLFYLVCFCYVTIGLKDVTAGWIVIGLQLFTISTCFFNIANEMLPGAVLAIVVFSSLKRFNKAQISVYFLLFFIVFSHLLVIVSILIFLIFECLQNRSRIKYLAQKYSLLIQVFALLTTVRLIVAFLDPYENSHLAFSNAQLHSFADHFNWLYLSHVAKFIITTFPEVVIMLLVLTVALLMHRKITSIFGVFLFTTGYVLFWLYYLNPETSEQLNRFNHVNVRWLFPPVFLIVVLFFVYTERMQISRYFYVGILILAGSSFFHLSNDASRAVNTVKQYKTLIHCAHDKEISKCYALRNLENEDVYYVDFYTSSMIYSALNGADSAVHIVLAQSEELADISHMKKDEFYLSKEHIISQAELNKKYFNLREDNYKLLSSNYLDCE